MFRVEDYRMRALTYVYDGDSPADHVETVLAVLEEREEEVDVYDVAAAPTREDGVREAMLRTKQGVGIGTPPDALYDEDGTPDFSGGVLVTEEQTGRRHLHVGREALSPLDGE